MLEHKFFKGLFSIIKLYFFLIFFLIFFYLVILLLDPLFINIFIMFSLTIGIFIDKRFNWKSHILILLIFIIQVIVYLYLELIPILLIKDLFWYSVVLNICFIWHVLVLHWCFEISLKYKWDYGCYLFSRISIITSLTGIYWIFNWISFLVNWIGEYFHWIFFLERASKNLNKIELLIWKFIDIKYFINLIISIFKSILLYFMTIFNNYSLLILGKTSNPFWEQPLKFYLSFIIFFLISIYLMPINTNGSTIQTQNKLQ